LALTYFILIKKSQDLKKEVALYYIGIAEKKGFFFFFFRGAPKKGGGGKKNELEKLDCFEGCYYDRLPLMVFGSKLNNKPIN